MNCSFPGPPLRIGEGACPLSNVDGADETGSRGSTSDEHLSHRLLHWETRPAQDHLQMGPWCTGLKVHDLGTLQHTRTVTLELLRNTGAWPVGGTKIMQEKYIFLLFCHFKIGVEESQRNSDVGHWRWLCFHKQYDWVQIMGTRGLGYSIPMLIPLWGLPDFAIPISGCRCGMEKAGTQGGGAEGKYSAREPSENEK